MTQARKEIVVEVIAVVAMVGVCLLYSAVITKNVQAAPPEIAQLSESNMMRTLYGPNDKKQ